MRGSAILEVVALAVAVLEVAAAHEVVAALEVVQVAVIAVVLPTEAATVLVVVPLVQDYLALE